MDRDDLSAALIAERGAVFMTALAQALPAVLASDLAGMEQRLRQVGRVVLGPWWSGSRRRRERSAERVRPVEDAFWQAQPQRARLQLVPAPVVLPWLSP